MDPVTFKAGQCHKDGSTLKADPKKGQILLEVEDGLLHFTWRQRTANGPSGEPEVDLMFVPGAEQVTFRAVAAGSRLYTLEVEGDPSRSLFFWMQEVKADRDQELCSRMNTLLTGLVEEDSHMEDAGEHDEGEPAADSLEAALRAGLGAGGQEPRRVQASDLAAILSGMGLPPPGTSSQPAAAAPSGQLSTAEQARRAAALLAQMAGHTGSSAQADQRTASEALRRMARAPGPSLGQLLNTETLQELLALPGMLETLGEHLPEQQRTPEGLRGVAGSAALRHQLELFSNALQTGQLDLNSFGLRAAGFTVADFLQAIQDQVNQEKQQHSGSTS